MYESGRSHDALLATLATLAHGPAQHDSSTADTPARVVLDGLRDGFVDRAADLGWRWNVHSTMRDGRCGGAREGDGGAGESTPIDPMLSAQWSFSAGHPVAGRKTAC
jgi:hypothetical protein